MERRGDRSGAHGGGLFGAVLSLLVGVGSDRLRRRPFLIGYEIVSLLAAGAILVTARPVALATAAIIAGFGRGANGAAGPFALDMGCFTAPFLVAAALQAAYVLLYGRAFRDYEPGEFEEIEDAGDERVRTAP